MSQAAQPHPGQVPTLTEVIELLAPTPVRDSGLNNTPRPEAPAPGSPDAAPIVTRSLLSGTQIEPWSPMTTVVVPSLASVGAHPATVSLADLPVLQAEVAELLPALPQLNEVVPEPLMPQAQQPLGLVVQAPPAELQAVPSVSAQVVLPEITEAQLAQRVLADVQRQIDGMLEFRLREAMGPLLAKHSEALVRDLREELGRTMRDVVARSVTQEMAKLRQR